MALKSVKSIILNSLITFRQKLLSDTPVKNDYKHALSLAGAYNLKQSIFPVGSIYLSINNTNPSTFLGGTWELLPANYVLKTITSGNGGVTSNAGNTGSTTLTAAQSGCPSHGHGFTQPAYKTEGAGGHSHSVKYRDHASSGAGGPTIHSLMNWSSSETTSYATNSVANHSHTVTRTTNGSVSSSTATNATQGHNHSAGMPANISVYAWKRTE